MRRVSGVMGILALCSVVLAGDQAPAATAVPAAAPAVAPAAGAPVLTWSGMAMLRLRAEIVSNVKQNDEAEKSTTTPFQIAYKFGANIKVNDQVTMAFDIGNDWYATEEAKGIPGNFYTKRNVMTPWFDQAWAMWNPGFMRIQAGIIPVKGSALMDLLGMSLFSNRSYARAAHIPWGVVTNFSQTGLRIGVPLAKDAFKLGIDLTACVIEQRSSLVGIDAMAYNHPADEILIEVPMSVAGFSANPQFFIIPNRTYSNKSAKGDVELGGGLDLGYKINPTFNLRAGFGYAQNSNTNSYVAGDSTAKDPFDLTKGKVLVGKFKERGINSNIGTTIILGVAKVDVDFNLSTDNDTEKPKVAAIYPFVDLKCGFSLNKNFIVTPRCRFFISSFSDETADYKSKLTIRPELIFTGMF
jgi:hypothetical protein